MEDTRKYRNQRLSKKDTSRYNDRGILSSISTSYLANLSHIAYIIYIQTTSSCSLYKAQHQREGKCRTVLSLCDFVFLVPLVPIRNRIKVRQSTLIRYERVYIIVFYCRREARYDIDRCLYIYLYIYSCFYFKAVRFFIYLYSLSGKCILNIIYYKLQEQIYINRECSSALYQGAAYYRQLYLDYISCTLVASLHYNRLTVVDRYIYISISRYIKDL